MLIELVDNFRGKKIGDVIDWPDHMAQILIDSKRAVIAKGGLKSEPMHEDKQEDKPEDKAVDAAPVDKMVRKSRIRRKS